MDVRKKQMNYNEIKKMGEAYAQVQEKMRQENADRAEAMLKFEAEKLAAMQEAIKVGNSDDDAIKMRKKIQNEKAPKVAKGKDVSVKGIAKASDKYAQQNNDASNDKSDDGDGMDKVDKKAVKKKFDDRKDKDIDNDGDTDDSDEYLHKRRKAISKNSGKGKDKETEVQTQEKVKEDRDVDKINKALQKSRSKKPGMVGRQNRDKDVNKINKSLAKARGESTEGTILTPKKVPIGKKPFDAPVPMNPAKNEAMGQDKTDGMSPNAKKELARATNEPAVDAEKSNKLNFATFKKMTKKSKDNG